MSLFIPTIPQPNDNLDFSQGQLLSNNGGLDTVFGVDHYKFSDASANKGFHNKVTTPVFVDSPPSGLPPVTTTNPIFYGFQDTANVGVIQYSRGPTNAVPTPITNLQSPVTPIVLGPAATTNVLDFTGIAHAFCLLHAGDTGSPTLNRILTWVFWTGSAFILNDLTSGISFLDSQNTGNILQLKNNNVGALNNVYWTLHFDRLS